MCTTGTFVVKGRFGRDMTVHMDLFMLLGCLGSRCVRTRSSPGGIPIDLRFNSETRLTCLNHPRAALKVPAALVSPSSLATVNWRTDVVVRGRLGRF
jgi:hypothetical protein